VDRIYAPTLHNKLGLILVQISSLKTIVVITRQAVITSSVPNLMLKERPPHNCTKMGNRLLEEKSKDRGSVVLSQVLAHIELVSMDKLQTTPRCQAPTG